MTDAEKLRLAEDKQMADEGHFLGSETTDEIRWLIDLAEREAQRADEMAAELRRVAPYLANHRFPGYTYTDAAHTRRTDARD